MEHRSFPLGTDLSGKALLTLLGLCLLAPGARAADPALALKHERAEQLDTEARSLREEAARVFNAEEAACRRRILVNDCIKAARQERLEKIEQARRLEAEQAAVAREIRYAEHAARREAKARRRAKEGPPPAVVIQSDSPKIQAIPLQ